MTSCTASGGIPVRSSSPFRAATPRSTARQRLEHSAVATDRRADGLTNDGVAHLHCPPQMCRPPVTSITVPVMYEDRSEAKNKATLATSLGSPARPIGISATFCVPNALRHGLRHRRANQAGSDRVHPNPQVRELFGRGLGHSHDPGLGRRVVGLADHADLARHRRHVDDGATLVFPHDRRGQPDAVPRPLQVHVDDLIELLLGHLAHRRVAGDSGVVDHDVQAAEPIDGGRDEGLDVGGLRDVAPHRQRDITAAQLFGRDFGCLEVEVAEHYPCALGDEPLRNGEAQTLCTTCDDCSLTVQQRHLNHASLDLRPSAGPHRANIIFHIGSCRAPGR